MCKILQIQQFLGIVSSNYKQITRLILFLHIAMGIQRTGYLLLKNWNMFSKAISDVNFRRRLEVRNNDRDMRTLNPLF